MKRIKSPLPLHILILFSGMLVLIAWDSSDCMRGDCDTDDLTLEWSNSTMEHDLISTPVPFMKELSCREARPHLSVNPYLTAVDEFNSEEDQSPALAGQETIVPIEEDNAILARSLQCDSPVQIYETEDLQLPDERILNTSDPSSDGQSSEGSSEMRVTSTTLAAIRSPLDGTFMQPEFIDERDLSLYFEEIAALGMDTIIIQKTRTKGEDCAGGECCGSEDYRWLDGFPSKLGPILDQAMHYGMEVYIGLDLTSHEICPLSFYREPNASLTIEDTRSIAQEIAEGYASHPAFAGWYLADEPSLGEWQQPELAYAYYAGLVSAIRQVSSKPILVSPHFVNVNFLTPEEMAMRAMAFRSATGIDVLIWQDAVGAEGNNIGWSESSQSMGDYLSQIVEVLGEEATWSLHEAFNCCVNLVEDEIGASYRPASIIRFSNQLQQARNTGVGKKIIWIQQHHFGSVDPNHHAESRRLLEEFKAYYQLEGEYLNPVGYEWLQEPDPRYRDQGNEMFNRRTGNPRDLGNQEWVGFDVTQTGKIEVAIDIGEEKTIEWFGFHLMNMPEAGIQFPNEMSMACSIDGEDWEWIGWWYRPVPEFESVSEYLFTNTEPISRTCRFIKAVLRGDDWIFTSEIEIVAQKTNPETRLDLSIFDLLVP